MIQINSEYYTVNQFGITCLLCSHYCGLKDGQTGICGVNKNENGRLNNLVYGKPAAINIDPIEKKPLYHFLPGTFSLSIGTLGCNMKCPFCQNWHISQKKAEQLTENLVLPKEVVLLALKNDCLSISYTYNEPTVFFPYAKDIAVEAKKKKLKNVFVTNGTMSIEVLNDMTDLIDACNVDLKSSDKNFYKKLLKAPFTVLDSLKQLKKNGIWVEITTLIIPQENDENKVLKEIAGFIADEMGHETPWHISAFHPDYKMTYKQRTSEDSLLKAVEIGKNAGLKHIYTGNSNLRNQTLCPLCNAPALERKGYNTINNFKVPGLCHACNYPIKGVWK